MATLALLLATVVWGWTFALVKDALREVGPFWFLALRFLFATLLAAPLLRREGAWSRRNWTGGGVLGMALFAGYFFQTWGLTYTTAQKSGLISGMAVVLVPPVAWLFGSRPTARTWLGVGLAGAGVALLTLGGGDPLGATGFGDFLTFLCAVSFAVYMVLLERYVRTGDWQALLPPQLGVVALLSLVGAWTWREPTFVFSRGVWGALAITGALATTGAYYALAWAERRIPAARAAIVLAMEPVFAGIFGWWLLGEVLAPGQLVGAGLVLSGILSQRSSR